jgi:hypothetical protein
VNVGQGGIDLLTPDHRSGAGHDRDVERHLPGRMPAVRIGELPCQGPCRLALSGAVRPEDEDLLRWVGA